MANQFGRHGHNAEPAVINRRHHRAQSLKVRNGVVVSQATTSCRSSPIDSSSSRWHPCVASRASGSTFQEYRQLIFGLFFSVFFLDLPARNDSVFLFIVKFRESIFFVFTAGPCPGSRRNFRLHNIRVNGMRSRKPCACLLWQLEFQSPARAIGYDLASGGQTHIRSPDSFCPPELLRGGCSVGALASSSPEVIADDRLRHCRTRDCASAGAGVLRQSRNILGSPMGFSWDRLADSPDGGTERTTSVPPADPDLSGWVWDRRSAVSGPPDSLVLTLLPIANRVNQRKWPRKVKNLSIPPAGP